MLRGLRRRLAAVFTAFTGVVLAGVLGVSYYLAAQQTVRDNEMWFSSTVDTVASAALSYAETGVEVSVATTDDNLLVEMRKDGEKTGAQRAAGVQSTALAEEAGDRLFAAAKQEAASREVTQWVFEAYSAADAATVTAAGGDTAVMGATEAAPGTYGVVEDTVITIAIGPAMGTEGLFSLEQDGVKYRATYFALPDNLEIAVMEDLSGQTRALWLMGLLYLLMLVGGLALLYLINWFLARLVLRPTEEGVRRQTEFVAAASHELRSPLAVIRSSLSAAQAAKEAQQAEKYRQAAALEAERMTHLVDDLLLLAGGDAGSWTLHPQPVDLDTLLIGAAEVYRPLARQKDVGLVLDLPEETLPTVKGDAERLRQILAVLLDNALQYAPSGTAITLTACHKRGKVRIAVADRGRGVPDDEKEKVFQRFYRADASRHDKEHFGLGLSVAQELAQLHGGAITVADTADGGATFTLALPVK